MDLLAIVPVFAANISNATGILKVFKLCKITRLIKASRYLGGIEEFSKSFRAKKKQIILSVIINSALLMICSILLHSAENNVQPDVFQNGFSGIYHCIRSALDSNHGVVALTSAGKALSALILMISACTVGVPLTIIATGFEHIVAESSSENSDSAVRRVTDLYDMLNDEQKEKVASHISSDMNTNA